MRARDRIWLICVPACLLGCAGGCGTADLRVEGPPAFVRCAGLAPPPEREFRFGDFDAGIDERNLVLEPDFERPVRMGVFSGPVSSTGVGDASVDLFLMLGNLASDDLDAQGAVRALAGLAAPVLFVAGGGDDASDVGAAFEDANDGNLQALHISGVHSIRIGDAHELVVAPGAPNGRYASGPNACGHTRDDLERRADALAEFEGTRVLVSWAAPTGVGSGLAGADPGSVELRDFIREIGAVAGLYAWPDELAGLSNDANEHMDVVARSLSRAQEDADGSRVVAGVTVVELTDRGMAVQ